MDIDFNRLKIFAHVYNRRSVTKAAHELQLSQPAISQHLKKLEQEVRVPLFTRSRKRLVPTPAAQRLYRRMQPLIEALEKEVRHLRRPLDTPYGLLRLGVSEFFSGHQLSQILTKFRYRFPTVTYSLSCGSNTALLSALSDGDSDISIVEYNVSVHGDRDIDSRRFIVEPILREPVVLVCSKPFHRRYFAGKAAVAELLEGEFLTLQGSRFPIETWFHYHYSFWPEKLTFALSTNDHRSFLSGIKNGMGLGVVPRYLIRSELSSGSLVVIKGSENEMLGELASVQLKNKRLSLTENAFLSIMKKELTMIAS